MRPSNDILSFLSQHDLKALLRVTVLPTLGISIVKGYPHRMVVRVLIVDDLPDYRRLIKRICRERNVLEIVGEAQDGVSAICKAEELQPDIVLLDISMPRLNGLDAALRILEVSARSKIVFLSGHFHCDLIQEAMERGASGYVIKSQAGSELLDAIDTVLRGDTFVSSQAACLKCD